MNVRLIWISILGSLIACAQDITVLVISAKDGHPFAEEPVHLMVGRSPHLPDGQSPTSFDRWLRTDGDGKVTFHPVVPEQVVISVIAGAHIQCSPGTYQSDQVLRTGIAQQQCPHRPQGKFGLPVRPGEIVIYIGEYSKLERILYLPWPG